MRRRSSQLWMPHPHIQVFLFILANLVFNLMSDDPVTKKCVANCGNPPTPLPLAPTTFMMNEKIVYQIIVLNKLT